MYTNRLFNFCKLITLGLIVIFLSGTKVTGQIPPRPEPPRLVNDFASLLAPQEINQLEQILVSYNDSTSTQITVVILPDLQGYDPDDLAQRIGQEWGVGQRNTNNGLVILIQPSNGRQKGQVAISTGYGLEEVITDLVSNRIIDQEMIPHFRENDYYGGIVAGVGVISDLLMGKYKADDYAKKKDGSSGFVVLLIFMIIIALSLIGKNKNNNHTIGRKNSSGLPFWVLMSMLGSAGRSSGSGHSGGFGGGGGFGSGGFGGGGGFGGFGGGSFGGGGASGSW